jgi:hypothetical protein
LTPWSRLSRSDHRSGVDDAKPVVPISALKFLGTEKQDGTDREPRDDARRVYEEGIAESPVQGSAEIWQGIRDRWGKELALAIAAQREFDPNVATPQVARSR